MTKEEKVAEIIKKLSKVYPHARTALEYETPWQLLVATMLSAQTTDKLVNTLTPALFEKYPDVQSTAKANPQDIYQLISKVNFAGNKSKNIVAAAQMIEEQFNGKVPETMEELDSLPGVARKTANVVLGDAFHKQEGIVVDTHVMRLSQKLGLTKEKTPEKIEQDLMQIVPKKEWTNFAHYLILFGREYCPARPHECQDCPLGDLCPDKS